MHLVAQEGLAERLASLGRDAEQLRSTLNGVQAEHRAQKEAISFTETVIDKQRELLSAIQQPNPLESDARHNPISSPHTAVTPRSESVHVTVDADGSIADVTSLDQDLECAPDDDLPLVYDNMDNALREWLGMSGAQTPHVSQALLSHHSEVMSPTLSTAALPQPPLVPIRPPQAFQPLPAAVGQPGLPSYGVGGYEPVIPCDGVGVVKESCFFLPPSDTLVVPQLALLPGDRVAFTCIEAGSSDGGWWWGRLISRRSSGQEVEEFRCSVGSLGWFPSSILELTQELHSRTAAAGS